MNKLAEIFKPTLSFIGSFDKLPEIAHTGDLCIVDNKEYVYGFGWHELGNLAINSCIDYLKIKNETLYLTEY